MGREAAACESQKHSHDEASEEEPTDSAQMLVPSGCLMRFNVCHHSIHEFKSRGKNEKKFTRI